MKTVDIPPLKRIDIGYDMDKIGSLTLNPDGVTFTIDGDRVRIEGLLDHYGQQAQGAALLQLMATVLRGYWWATANLPEDAA